jgi:hypothetical protein
MGAEAITRQADASDDFYLEAHGDETQVRTRGRAGYATSVPGPS